MNALRGDKQDDGAADTHSTVEAEPAVAARIFGAEIGAARRYVEWLVGDGVERGVLGPREAGRIWSRHVLNCAVVAPLVEPDARVVDVGSGAGLPGVPLALARPDVAMTLVEPLERRSAFLLEVVADLGLANCGVVRSRAEDAIELRAAADVVTSRAVAPLAKLAGWSVPLLRSGGELLALKGRSAQAEVDRDRAVLSRLGLIDQRVEEVGGGALDESTTVVRATFSGARRPARRSARPRLGRR